MFKISEFSRFTRVTVKMLRHYDEVGLLKPAQVDPTNNYRLYSADQLPRLNRILALKDLGFSLEEISKLLADEHQESEVDMMFLARKAEIKQKIETETRRLLELESRLRMMKMGGDRLGNDIILRAVPAQWIASIRTRIPWTGSFAPLFGEIETFAAEYSARAKASPLSIYHDMEFNEAESDVEIAVPVERPLPARGQIGCRELPGESSMVCATYRGGYGQSAPLLNSMLHWIEAHQYEITGPLREVYHRFNANELQRLHLPESFLTEAEAEFVTELQIPLALGPKRRQLDAKKGK